MQPQMVLWLCILFCGLSASAASTDELSKAHTAFAVDLYKQIGDANNGKNLFFSPISISTAFGMVSLGARGNTREQTKAVLHLDKISSDETVKEAYRQLLTTFKDQANNYTLHMVNRLYGSEVFQFHDQFIQETLKYFKASLERLDFKGKAEESRRHINEWVEEQTNQKIRDLLSSGTIDAQTILVIVNAIYFKALWEHPFNDKFTKLGPFRISKSQVEDVQMMHLNDEYLNYHDSSELNCEVLELPYQGNKASMFVFLPYEVDGLPHLEKKLSGVKLTDTLSKVQSRKMVVQLPKFSIDQDISLKKFLQMMGMVDVFGDSADLSGIGSGRLAVTDAIHKAFVNVSESGTEAAAATAVLISLTSSFNPSSPTNFIVDRPFLFLIYEKNTQSVLFMGRLVRPPTAKESIGKFGETAALHGTAASISAAIFSSLCSVLLLPFVYWRL